MKHRTRTILACIMGNIIEIFDMAICGFLSIYFAKYLIGDSSKGLLLVFFTFFAGYIARPLGAAFLGIFSDRCGRKVTLAISVLSMGIATAFIGFIPSHESIGNYAMIILLVLRIIQSFSCGAEYLNSSTYLMESALSSNKGYTASWTSFGTMVGLLIASLTSLFVKYFVSVYPEWEWIIWRIPFVLGLLGSSIGLYIRMRIPESIEYIMYYADNPKPTVKDLLRQSYDVLIKNKLQVLYVFILSYLGVATTFQIYVYSPIQAHIYGNIPDQNIFLASIISIVFMLCILPMMGKLSDKINREKIVIFASLGLLVCSIPYFYSLAYGDWIRLALFQCLISIPASAYYATVPVLLTEMFPVNLRCTVLSVLYSVAASLAAGFTPLLSLMLLESTHNPIAPSFIFFILVVVCLFLMRSKNRYQHRILFDSILEIEN